MDCNPRIKNPDQFSNAQIPEFTSAQSRDFGIQNDDLIILKIVVIFDKFGFVFRHILAKCRADNKSFQTPKVIFQFVFEMSTVFSNGGTKTWTKLFYSIIIDDQRMPFLPSLIRCTSTDQ